MASKTVQSASYLAKPDIHESWQSDYLNRDLERFYKAAFDRLIISLGVKPGDRLLDAGCGYCHHACRFLRAGIEVTGIDFSPAAIEAARANLAKQGLSIDLRQGDLLDLSIEDNSFHYVVCWGVLMHIPEVEKALNELIRVTAPGGRLALSEVNQRSFDVAVWEPAIIQMKRMLRRRVPRRDLTPRGTEEWRDEGLMIRKTDLDWLIGFMTRNGMQLVERFAGQFTETYVSVPNKALKRLIYRFNEWWFNRNGSPRHASSNILVFEKTGGAQTG
jgi:ubiquinone/menaquinone biosynthesis C-methylase UbiE